MKNKILNIFSIFVAMLLISATVSAQNISEIEYFIDTDPGFGAGTSVSASGGSDVEANFTVPLAGVSNGVHTLYVRAKDSNNNWSLLQSRTFIKGVANSNSGNLPNIVEAEYFIDEDPGFGSAMAISISPDSDIEVNFTADLSTINNGVHTLYVRAKDSNNNWSLLQSRTFIKGITNGNGQSIPNISVVEYFIDDDPGFGNGESIPYSNITGPDDVVADFTAQLNNINNGVHTLYVRAKDSNNNWSLLQSRTFIKMPGVTSSGELPDITKVEYFIDTDPGLDQGTYIPFFNPATDISETFLVPLNGVALGDHTLYVRAQDENGNWSIAASRDFEIINGNTISGTVTDVAGNPIEGVLIEFNGLGTVISLPDGSYSFAVPFGWSGTAEATLEGFTFNEPALDFTNNAVNSDLTENIQATDGETTPPDGTCLNVGSLCVTADNTNLVSGSDYLLTGNPRIKKDGGEFIIYFTGPITVNPGIDLITIPSGTTMQIKNIGASNLTYNIIEGPAILNGNIGSSELTKSDALTVLNSLFQIAGLGFDFQKLKVNDDNVEYEGELEFPEFMQQDLWDSFNNNDFKTIKTDVKFVYHLTNGLSFGGGLSIPTKVKILKQIELNELNLSYDPSNSKIAGGAEMKMKLPPLGFEIDFEIENGLPNKIGGSVEVNDPNPNDVFIPGLTIPGTGMKITKYIVELDNLGAVFDDKYDEDKGLKIKGGLDITAAVPPPVLGKVAYQFTDASITYEHGQSLEFSSKLEILEEQIAKASVKFLKPTEAEIKADASILGMIDAAMAFSIATVDMNGEFKIALRTPSDDFINENVESRLLRYILKKLPNDKKFAQGGMALGSDFQRKYSNRLAYIAAYASIPNFVWDEIFIYAQLQDNMTMAYKAGTDFGEIPPNTFSLIDGKLIDPLLNDTVFYDVTENTPKFIIDVDNASAMPDFEVVLPNGDVVNLSNQANFSYVDFWEDTDEFYTACIIKNPDAGRYGVVRGNVDSDNEALKAWGINTKPCIDILDVTDNGNGTITIDWFDSDPDSNAKIDFRIDKDREGHNGLALVEDINENSSINSITVDYSDSYTGDYYLYAQITDELGATGYDYYDLPINIVNGSAPNTPMNLSYSLADSILTLNWDKNGNDDAIYYNVYYANEPGTISFNSDKFSYDQESGLRVVDLVPGRYYEFAVSAYDSLYRESGFSNIESLTYISSLINNEPYFEIQNIPTTTYMNQTYSYSLQATDEDGDNLSFSFIESPNGMSVSSGGQISWIPTIDDLGLNKVNVLTDDNNGGQDSIAFYIQVIEAPTTAMLNFSKNYFLTADNAAMLTINDLDAPGNANEVDNLSVRVYSNSDNTGITFNAVETSIDSKVYNICFGLNNIASSSNSLLVAVGDTIFAEYQDVAPNQLVTTIAHYGEGPQCTQTINLNGGWNLISFNVSPSDPTIASVFSSLESNNLLYVTGFDNGAKVFDPNLPSFLNTLVEVEDGFGYWVKLQNADVLEVEGTCLVENYRKPYDAGWNLVAYPPNNPQSVSNYYEELLDLNDLLFVTGFNNGTITFDPALPSFLNTLTNMENGFGYWIKIDDNSTGKMIQNPTNIFNFINGTSNLPAGERVNVISENGEIIAVLEVIQEGYLMTTAVYGDDPLTEAVQENIKVGEKLLFSWNNQLLDVNANFTGDLSIQQINLVFEDIVDSTNELAIIVYPVPAKDIINFEFNTTKEGKFLLQIFDAKGQLVQSIKKATLSTGTQVIDYNVQNLANGVYTYKIIAGEQEQAGKFEVIR